MLSGGIGVLLVSLHPCDCPKAWLTRKSAAQNFQKARDRLEDLRKGGGTKQKMRVSRSNMKKQSDGECLVM